MAPVLCGSRDHFGFGPTARLRHLVLVLAIAALGIAALIVGLLARRNILRSHHIPPCGTTRQGLICEPGKCPNAGDGDGDSANHLPDRSEERRVGKESRSLRTA